jgi:hypothetical protein
MPKRGATEAEKIELAGDEDSFGPDGPIPIIGSGEGWTTELMEAACTILEDNEILYIGSANLDLVWLGVRQEDRHRAHRLLSADKRLIPFLVPPDQPPEPDTPVTTPPPAGPSPR